ncbi:MULTISPECIES: putative DNA modification/repair radical SAM protein [Clostridium]|uniref:putative DNA modification/repair radical SAM protein n=1 Tax=Clostridium TaxID=1485 RepID=UPI00019B0216|nr:MULTISPECIES: putative DNA modification/repair radical SAM protein [Clostridium]EEH98470.1 putative DNA modification/repair radical SAM protein [Clostridium sp. 7_2_43FAA]MDB1948284.1 putative DNA modification/repair radical SAM protein [Clostridium tertium]MDU8966890.1 putative DNA modification/repair radical SAM protein [Clostridium sp.]
MNIDEKLNILSAAAKYDVSCSSSGSKRKNLNNGIGNAENSGICHSFTADGRCISLLKILLTNYCIYNCKYCVNASTKDVPRAMFTPDEIVSLTINFYKRNYIEGLFLSSAIFKTPNYTMELLLNVVKKLRIEEKFNGYIHLKAIPGADEALIKEAGKYADRMSVNIELPSASSLKLLAPQKNKENILSPMSTIKNSILENKDLKKNIKSTPLFVPGGQSTQLIVGATPESDYKILNLSENLYNRFNLKRVYYSAYVPVIKNDKVLPNIIHPPLVREHRLYQADWLLRFYGFKAKELLKDENDSFDLNFDPKTSWALSNIENFPIEINKASYDTLLRIPGIGVRSARRILITRKVHSLTFEDLKKLGIVLKRAKYFITCKGKYYGDVSFDEEKIRTRLLYMNRPKLENENSEQLNFFDNIYPKTSNGILLPEPKKIIMPTDKVTSITGEF